MFPSEIESWDWMYNVIDSLFAIYFNDIVEYPNKQIHLSFRFGNNILESFPSKVWTTRQSIYS